MGLAPSGGQRTLAGAARPRLAVSGRTTTLAACGEGRAAGHDAPVDLTYQLLNVFTVEGVRLSGNPLCVFEDGRGLDAPTMQALARQLNLSETTFVLPPTAPGAAARVRIFTPDFEMPFAGHPTLGTAQVVSGLVGGGAALVLELAAGLVEVRHQAGGWTLRAARAPGVREPAASPDELAALVGLPPGAVARPLWVDTGVEQLLLPVRRAADVRAARPDAARLALHGRGPGGGEAMAYVFAEVAPGQVAARFFFMAGGGVVEDPATGSACANLGGWLLATGAPLPARLEVAQGEDVGRPSRLHLLVDQAGQVFVSGQVVALGRGVLTL
ncbi:MAG: PhzF family phenazine biosynthesis protein [Anaeromyxobacter sp.]|nr:PhzF family phenazine biosynthesis protein [Anaeromyxobacter sp.]